MAETKEERLHHVTLDVEPAQADVYTESLVAMSLGYGSDLSHFSDRVIRVHIGVENEKYRSANQQAISNSNEAEESSTESRSTSEVTSSSLDSAEEEGNANAFQETEQVLEAASDQGGIRKVEAQGSHCSFHAFKDD